MNSNVKSSEMHKIFVARALNEKDGCCLNCGRKILDSFYQKKNKQYVCICGQNINPMSHTPLHKSHIPLDVWFSLIREILYSDKGIDPKHIVNKYKLSNESAWAILYRIKEWINMVEENENCKLKSAFIKQQEKFREKYFFKYNKEIPPKQMENKLLRILPPLFDHLRVSRFTA